LLDFPRIQGEVEDFEVGLHVADVGGAGQGYHAHVEGEPEDDLANGSSMTFRDSGQLSMSQHSAIGSQQREALIENSVRSAELTNVTVPAPLGVAPVLDEAWPDLCLTTKGLKLLEGDVLAPSKRPRPLC
jgi:hypothetical protein